MTKKDFELIAQIMRYSYQDSDLETWTSILNRMLAIFPQVNSRFNSDRFVKTCYPSHVLQASAQEAIEKEYEKTIAYQERIDNV